MHALFGEVESEWNVLLIDNLYDFFVPTLKEKRAELDT